MLETWTLTKRDRKQLNVFESKVYRRILGPVYDNESLWKKGASMYFWSETTEWDMEKKDTTMNYMKYLINQTF